MKTVLLYLAAMQSLLGRPTRTVRRYRYTCTEQVARFNFLFLPVKEGRCQGLRAAAGTGHGTLDGVQRSTVCSP
eukprot:2093063-Rhodomonas_salina.1